MTKRWQPAEDRLVRKHYPKSALLAELLLNRTRSAIRVRFQVLGLSRNFQPWTGADLVKLRRVAGTMPLADAAKLFPGGSAHAVKTKIREQKLTQPKIKVTSTVPVLEDVRQRCRQLGLSYRSVAHAVGYRAQCLNPASWDARGPAPSAIAKLCDRLGGDLYVEWDE